MTVNELEDRLEVERKRREAILGYLVSTESFRSDLINGNIDALTLQEWGVKVEISSGRIDLFYDD